MTDNKPEITPATRTRGTRTLQYYGLRFRWKWEFADKTRDLAGVMRRTWGNELDIVTMLGAEPQSPDRDWQRFDSQLEIVDLGRNKKKAQEVFKELKEQTKAEEALRKHADRDMNGEFRAELERVMETDKNCRAGLAKTITGDGLFYAAQYKSMLKVGAGELQAEWAEAVLGKAPEKNSPLIGHLRMARKETKKALLSGEISGSTSWNADDVEKVMAGAKHKALLGWKNTLTDMINRWEKWQEAKKTIADRKLGVLVDRITEKTGELGAQE